MSDDLVDKLYDRRVCSPAQNSCRNDWLLNQCCDRIEELEAKLAKVIILSDAMAEAIEDQMSLCDASMDEQIAVKNYRATLAELKGGNP